MTTNKISGNVHILQVAGWVIVYLINVIYLLPETTTVQALVNPLVWLLFTMMIIYGNVLILIPAFYEKKKYLHYSIVLAIFFITIVALRVWVNHMVFFNLFGEQMHDYTVRQIQYVSLSTFLIVLVSFLFYATIRYFNLLRMQSVLESKHFQTELKLLKAQVQPHFLFNTLNNIYYEVYKDSPRGAELIERVSEMMRYFVDESPKEKILLSTEIQFLKSYIELEKIRIRGDVKLLFTIDHVTKDHLIPPMLLIPLVENLFKHGINKLNTYHEMIINLQVKDTHLFFSVANPFTAKNESRKDGGFGLKNLRSRLELLYKTDFTLVTEHSNGQFISELIIPLS